MAPQIYPPEPANGPEYKDSGPNEGESSSHSPITSSPLWRNRFPILVGTYIALTSTLFYRVSRSPLSTSRKWEQYETIFKGTTLAGVVAGIGLSGGLNRKRSEVVQERLTQQHERNNEKNQLECMSEKEKQEAKEMVRKGGVQRD